MNKKILVKTMVVSSFILVFATALSVNNYVQAGSIPERLKGRILLQVEKNGEAWYVNPADSKRYFMGRPQDAFSLMQDVGVGIINENLNKIPIAEANMEGDDADGDGLSDAFEDAVGTDKNNTDTDNDGHNDKEEVTKGFNPTGTGAMAIDNSFAEKHKGKVFIQVESHGEAWYINPTNNKRYFLFRPIDAFNVMRSLGLGITNKDLEKIEEDKASVKTCSEQSGNACSQSQSCSGSWIDASDTDKCCSGSCAAETASTGSTDENSPFGIQEFVELDDYLRGDKNAFNDAQEAGVKWIRLEGTRSMLWGLVETNEPLGNPDNYYWDDMDERASILSENGFNIMWNINPYNPLDQKSVKQSDPKKTPIDLESYAKFVKAAVERYDGDGTSDAPGSPVVNYWQIGNEVDGANFWGDTAEAYAELLKTSYEAVKEGNSNAKVLIAGLSMPEGLYNAPHDYISIFENLDGGKYFDIMDVHWYEYVGDYKKHPIPVSSGGNKLTEFMDSLKETLGQYGHGNAAIWFTEVGTYSGSNVIAAGSSETAPSQTEKEHAAEVLKRYIYFVANGVEKVFWHNMLEGIDGGADHYFNNNGLVYNGDGADDPGTEGLKKLAYYTYKLMTEKLEGSDWDSIATVKEDDNGVYAYKFTNSGKNIWVAWNDDAQSRTVSLGDLGISGSASVTEAIPDATGGSQLSENDYPGFFNAYTASNEITIEENPIFIEEI